jgi:hypothetical protein
MPLAKLRDESEKIGSLEAFVAETWEHWAGSRSGQTRSPAKGFFGVRYGTYYEQISRGDSAYIFVIVKLPDPWQPAPPVRVHMPEIVFPFAVPVRVSMLLLGDPDCTVNWNFPVTLPLTFPLRD